MIRSVIVKVASACNLRCTYCYVEKSAHARGKQAVFSLAQAGLLVQRVADYCAEKNVDEFTFCWHGGEPLLAGKEFYRQVLEEEAEVIPDTVVVENAIQTNGVLLDDEWVRMFKAYDLQAAVSLDGPADIHDRRRVTGGGLGTHDRIVQNLDLFRAQDYPIRILAVVTPESLSRGREIYQYFRDLGCAWMDFLYPICNRVYTTFDQRVDPAALGRFYCEVFDAWLEEGDPRVHVRTLNDWSTRLLGGQTITCHSRTDCSYVITVDTDGSIQVCDDLLAHVDSGLGHIDHDSLGAIERHPVLRRLADCKTLFCEECRACEFFKVCAGGCSLFRITETNQFGGPNFFCETQRMTISHIREVLLSLGS